MKVKDFIKWLETQDQEAVVEVMVHDAHGGYYTQGGTVCFADFDPEKGHFEYIDLRGNRFISEDSWLYGRRSLFIGYSECY